MRRKCNVVFMASTKPVMEVSLDLCEKIKDLLQQVNATNDINEKVRQMKEIFICSRFGTNPRYNFAMQYECSDDAKSEKWYNEQNGLRKFLEYKKDAKESFYGDGDCDTSIAAVTAYKSVYPVLESAELKKKYNKNLQYEFDLDGVRYGGDTLTSALTVLKRYLDYTNILSNNSSSWINLDQDVCRLEGIWEQMDETAKGFLKTYMTLGNYICIPCKGYEASPNQWVSINNGRSNFGKWDTVDCFLWKMYEYFSTMNPNKLLDLFTNCKEELREEVLNWNKQFGIKTWNDFVEVHAFQDFVEVIDAENKIYGRPISLKFGDTIQIGIDEEYDPMPQDEEECIEFFKTVSDLILKRGNRMRNRML